MNTQVFAPFPTRSVPTGTYSLAAYESLPLAGTNGRQGRYLLVVCNLNAAGLAVKLRSTNGVNMHTYFASTSIGLPVSGDVVLYNPNATPVEVEVLELFYDEGVMGPSVPGEGSLRAGAVQATRISGNRSSFFGPGGGNPRSGG
jgi:hypothetical protein